MTAPPPKFDRKEIGSANVQFPSGSSMPDPLDVAVDPYAPTKKVLGTKIKGFQAWPQKHSTFPAVLILHERWGLTQHYQDLAYRLAQQGYVALAVDQYSRIGSVVTSDTDHAGQLVTKLSMPLLMQDLTAAVEYLNYQEYVKKHRIAVLGFDTGATHALSFAAVRRQLRACIAFYGKIPPESLGSLRCPVQYHQAAQDESVSARDIAMLSDKLKAQHVICEVHTYSNTEHGFFNDTRQPHNADAAVEAWTHALRFLDQYILAEHAGVRPLPDSQRKF